MINKSIKYSPKVTALGFLGKSSFMQVCNRKAAAWAFLSFLKSSKVPYFVCRQCSCHVWGQQQGAQTNEFKIIIRKKPNEISRIFGLK